MPFQPRHAALVGLALLAGLSACKESSGPGETTSIFIDSDPRGAAIYLDDGEVGTTPDTLEGVSVTRHLFGVTLDSAGVDYGFFRTITTTADSIQSFRWPLVLFCPATSCIRNYIEYVDVAGLELAMPPNGSLFLQTADRGGIVYPQQSGNNYMGIGAPLSAGYLNGLEPAVGPNIYDLLYYVGRPAPTITQGGGSFSMNVDGWIYPPENAQAYWTGRALDIRQTITADNANPGVVIIRVVFTNLAGNDLYIEADPAMAEAPDLVYKTAYLGFAMDPDVGVPNDDLVSYDPDLNLVFAYDSDFMELEYGAQAEAPALVGLRMLEAPAGANIILTGWPRGSEWTAATAQESFGWDVLSGTQDALAMPNHADPHIGFVPRFTEDMRIAVTAGPIDIAAGDSAVIRVAVILADPVPGTFTAGDTIDPGDPFDTQRQIRQVAGQLIQRAAAAGQ